MGCGGGSRWHGGWASVTAPLTSAPHMTLLSVQSRLTLHLLTSLGATGCNTRVCRARGCFAGTELEKTVLRRGSPLSLAAACGQALWSLCPPLLRPGTELRGPAQFCPRPGDSKHGASRPACMAQGPHGAQRFPPGGFSSSELWSLERRAPASCLTLAQASPRWQGTRRVRNYII